MIKSMTGYGKAVCQLEGRSANIEIKSLNSKQLDLNVRMPSYYRDKELDVRKEAQKWLQRGKAEVSIFIETAEETGSHHLNQDTFKRYYKELKSLSDELSIDNTDLLSVVMRMPEVLQSEKVEADENEWEEISQGIMEAVKLFEEFRSREGKVLEDEFVGRIQAIQGYLQDLEVPEKSRIESVKEKILSQIEQLTSPEVVDKNRLEQELLYYVEKLDIAEEKTRLKMHCSYFLETLGGKESSGKKLNFISQEIGREVNTIGSKANNADMQKIVVDMKEELEKIKEQLANVL